MAIYKSILDLVGGTPLVELTQFEKENDLKATVLAKLEYFNPAGSVKDRIAKAIVEDAEKSGKLQPGGTIIEPTSGNTGIGLAAVAAAKKYRLIITMPETMSVERRNLMKAYGAELVLTEGAKGMKGAIAKAEELHEQIPGSIIAGQFVNPVNPATHKATTGPEIWKDTEGKVDIFVAGVGTGGTVSGVGAYLKSQNPNVKVVAVEPRCCPPARAAPIRFRVSAPALFRIRWIPRSTTRLLPSPMKMLLPPASAWPSLMRCSPVSAPVQPFGRPSSWPSARRTQARPSWPCCRIPATATCPPRCSRTDFSPQRIPPPRREPKRWCFSLRMHKCGWSSHSCPSNHPLDKPCRIY